MTPKLRELIDDMYDLENHTRNLAISMSKENIIKAFDNLISKLNDLKNLSDDEKKELKKRLNL